MAAKPKANWHYVTKIEGLDVLLAQFNAFPKALNGALKRAGRKSNTQIVQTMREKVPKKGKKIKFKRKATFKERIKTAGSGIYQLLERKLLGIKRRKKKAKQYFGRAQEAGKTGMLRKSIGSKVGVNRRTGEVYAIAGPRRKKDGFETSAYSPWLRKMVKVIPSKYAHLVERGFTLTIRGRTIRRLPGKPFVRPAYDENKGKIEGLTSQVIQEELDKLFAKKAKADLAALARSQEVST